MREVIFYACDVCNCRYRTSNEALKCEEKCLAKHDCDRDGHILKFSSCSEYIEGFDGKTEKIVCGEIYCNECGFTHYMDLGKNELDIIKKYEKSIDELNKKINDYGIDLYNKTQKDENER